MPVVHVRRVRMGVRKPVMLMPVRVRFAGRVVRSMLMSVVFVVHMRMHVRGQFVDMFVLVTLGDVEPNSQSHECARRKQRKRDIVAKREDGNEGAHEWRSREIGTGARGAQIAKRTDIKREAHAVSQEPHRAGRKQDSAIRQVRAVHVCEQQVDRAGDQPLQHGNLQWIGR